MKQYFVSYAVPGGFGRCTMLTPDEINSVKRIAEVEAQIAKEHSLSELVIINYFEMPVPGES